FTGMVLKAKQSEAKKDTRLPVVLVVEDEIMLRHTTACYLRLSGFQVVEATNAADAIAVLASGELADVVFSDVYMSSGPDGLKLAGWLGRCHPDIPMMLTSGYDEGVCRAATELVGEERFLSKPYRLTEATRRLRALLGLSRAGAS